MNSKTESYKHKLTEAELKRQVWDYLTYGANQGKWYFDRLNSGAIYEKRGNRTYGVMLCREGTADFMVFMKRGEMVWGQRYYREGHSIYQNLGRRLKLIFLELKGEKGKQSQQQKGFQLLVENQGALYYIIRTIEELEDVLV